MAFFGKQMVKSSLIEEFARSQRAKTIAFLRKNYNLSKDDCEDVFQDSFITLYHSIKSGKLDHLTSSISTYFMAICRNKTLELLRSSNRFTNLSFEDSSPETAKNFSLDQVDKVLSLNNDDTELIEEKESIVRDLVRNLPSPCNEMLWGFFRDGLSMKELAIKYGYSNENSAKVTKHRCCDKFRRRYEELLEKFK